VVPRIKCVVCGIIRASQFRFCSKRCYFGGQFTISSREAQFHGALFVPGRRRRSMINSLNFTRLCHLQQNDHVTERVSDSNSLSPRHRNCATMTSQTPGILRWTSSIRNSMINDPGRQFFEDQVQSQGFLFLEEYLDNIWAAAKQE
jgi:hypothetical protein